MRVIGLAVLAASLALTPLATGAQPGKVTVPRGRFAKRDFVYDSGIR